MSEDKPTRRVIRLVEARAELMDSIWGTQKLYNHSFLCSVGLPHRKPKEGTRTYEKSSGNISLQLTAGHIPDASGNFIPVGIPYGPKARLLLLHLCSRAVMTQDPEVEVEDSFTAFARGLGLGTCGRSLGSLREQIIRTSAVSMRLAKKGDHYLETFQSPIFSHFQAELPASPDQRTLFPSYVRFSHEFFMSLRDHAVPLRLEAIGALTHNSRGLDIYCWLAQRLYRLKKPQRIRWTSLRFQFGSASQDMRGFKRRFYDALKQVLIVYPEAKVTKVDGGIMIHPSRPPVPMRPRSRGLLQ